MRPVLSVSELTSLLKDHIQSTATFTQVAVLGEVSNFSRPASGHLYFTLKDERARLRVVMFASKARFLRFHMRDGMRVIVQGGLDVFERTGDYQLYAEGVQPDGIGALYLAFEQLRDRLAQEGLFDPLKKRALPLYPKRIALITSATGAAVRDMITTLKRRYPLGDILIVPVAVQGDEAPRQIADAIALVCANQLADVMIVGRGGGSLEELYAFNTEVVARAIANASIPVVSGVGHETDVTIADYVADRRAATPTAAAELVSVDLSETASDLTQSEHRLAQALQRLLRQARERLDRAIASRSLRDPLWWLGTLEERVDRLESQLQHSLTTRVNLADRRLSALQVRLAARAPTLQLGVARSLLDELDRRLHAALRLQLERAESRLVRALDRLELLSPLAVMRRGYAAVIAPATKVVIGTIDAVQPGDSVHVQMADGWLDCQVWGVYEADEEAD